MDGVVLRPTLWILFIVAAVLAGPARGRAQAAATPAPHAGVRVRFVPGDDAERDGNPLVVHVRRRDRWERLCAAPCDRPFAPGEYALGLSIGASPVVAMRPGLTTRGRDLAFFVRYVDRTGDRPLGIGLAIGGVLVMGGGGGGALAGALALLGHPIDGFFGLGVFGVAVGLVAGFVGGLAMLIVGSVLATQGPAARATPAPDLAWWPADGGQLFLAGRTTR